MGYKVAIVGATGNVGREMLNVLAERKFPVSELYALASRRSIGTEVSFGDTVIKCRDLETFDFKGIDFCLMSAALPSRKNGRRGSVRKAPSSSITHRAGATTRTCR